MVTQLTLPSKTINYRFARGNQELRNFVKNFDLLKLLNTLFNFFTYKNDATPPKKTIKYCFLRGSEWNSELPIKRVIIQTKMVPQLGIEPRTQGFSVPCSTN